MFKKILKLFNRSPLETYKTDDDVQFKRDKFIRIQSMNFFGRFSKSENSEWKIAWSDSDPASGTGGYRKSGKGTFVLLHGSTPCFSVQVERPSLPNVANNGTFLINDMLFDENAGSVLYIFNSAGQNIFQNNFTSKIYSTGISACGKFAACKLYFSDSEDSGLISFINIDMGRIEWKKQPYPGWGDEFIFDSESKILSIKYQQGYYRVDFSGTPLDANQFEEDTIAGDDLYSAIDLLKKRTDKYMQSRNSTELQKIKSTFENMIEKTKNADPAYSAKIYRYLGEIDEFIGEEPSAIKNYEAASSYDDKIGVTRKLQALKRKNQSPLQGA
jgi:hypothetical protein